MNTIQSTLRAALTLYASHIADMQRAADTVSPRDNVRLDEILAARSRVEGMRKDLAEAFAHVHDMQRDRDWRSLDESADSVVPCDKFGAPLKPDPDHPKLNPPPGFHNWLVHYIARQRRESLLGGAAAELSRAGISEDLTHALQRAGWIE